jgi:uncharacterized C2H2 Zn-finger protein
MSQKPPVVYNCQNCLYITDNKKDYNRHLKTRKHQQNEYVKNTIGLNKTVCPLCNKVFKSRTSIYKHKPICRGAQPLQPDPPHPDPTLVLVPDQASLTLEQIKQIIIENRILKELLVKTGLGTT